LRPDRDAELYIAGNLKLDIMNDRIAAVNGVEICIESFGDPNDSPLLLIMGAAGINSLENRIINGARIETREWYFDRELRMVRSRKEDKAGG
jgi:hypothetical protein